MTKIKSQGIDTTFPTLGYAQITNNVSFIGAESDVSGLSVTVNVPPGGRSVKITAYAAGSNGTANQGVTLLIYEGATQLQSINESNPVTNQTFPLIPMIVITPSPGSHTYKVRTSSGGTGNIVASSTAPAFILVELI